MAWPVWHYDGKTGERHTPRLTVLRDGQHFALLGDGVDEGPYGFAELVPHGARAGEPVYGIKARPGWRIGFLDQPDPALAALLPRPPRYGRWIDRFGLWPSVGVLALFAALVVAGVLQLPPILAHMVPQSVERRMGTLMVGDFGKLACTSAQGDAALRALAARIGGPKDVTIRVVRIPVINAVAFPGGQVVLFDGMIQNAESPDEVAGVLAHELGHVAHRDGMESLIRQYGLAMLFGGIDSHVGTYGNALLSARYSRATEARADDYAIERLQAAQVSPRPTAAFFQRIAKAEAMPGEAGAWLSYLSSHPLSSARERRFADSARAGTPYPPALTAVQWQALRTMCR